MIVAKVNPSQWEQLKEKLAAEGVLVAGNAGVVSQDDVRADLSYDGSGVLEVTVTHKPLLVPLSVIEGRIADGIRQAGVECSQQG